MSSSLFDLILLALAIYVLYSGIRGKGRLYNLENIKEGMEKPFIRLSRRIYILLGVGMLINSGSSMLRAYLYSYQEVTAATDTTAAVYDWVPKVELGQFSFLSPKLLGAISYVALGATIVLVVLLIILMRKYIDKNAQQKASSAAEQAQRNRQAGHTLPVSAFEFDETPAQAADYAKEGEGETPTQE